ncbi:unnamed protein product [Clonostachys rosea]|uniref:Erythromycin biosynthesis protein CIII-like C-terminal domain-containing protein n=1 Tax=Bionectria ochroleuca TaxID=29856 RepID=A0ABY6TV36_BIOOC|nr:unnamed protein product [Clonostachys rosea]
MATPTKQKPWLLVCASPAAGHANPVINITAALVERGYKVAFITGKEFEDSVRKIGADVIGTLPPYEEELFKLKLEIPDPIAQLQFDMRNFFINRIQPRKEALYTALEQMRSQAPEREIVIVTESWYMGTLPLYLGAPLPKGFSERPRIVNIHAAAYMFTSVDTAPFGLALPPDSSEEGRVRNKTLHEQMLNGPWKELIAEQGALLAGLGATDYEPAMLFDTWTTAADVTLQTSPPGLEYVISDPHPKIKFVGALVPKERQDNAVPDFWSEVTRGDKKVVVVTQGTVDENFEQLIIPTLEALADRDDLLVMAILGKKGAALQAGVKVPANARIVDYLRYDTILAHASAFVTNAGYGGVIHGMVNGVPMVLSGASEDKPEVANRAEYAGIGINLKTGSPTREQVSEAVGKILSETTYQARATKLKDENEQLKAIDKIEEAILGGQH